jgi:DNA-binding NarL/FixJ family response regulator
MVTESSEGRICVAVVEDHPSTAEGLALGLVGARFTVLPTVTSPTLLDGPIRPDVVICDLHLGDVPIRDTVLAVTGRGLRVLAVSGPATRDEILDAVEAGAQGFVHKTETTRTICRAAAEVAGGGCWISPQLAGHLLADAQVRPLARNELGGTELAVLRALAQGESTESIGDRLDIESSALRAIRIRIFDAERRRRPLLRPSPRELDTMRHVGARGLSQRQAATEMGITEGTVAEYLHAIKAKYLRTHPGTRPDITPVTAARWWAAQLGLD